MNTDGESPQANMDGSQSKQLSNISVHPEAVRPIPIRLVPIRLPHRPLPRRIPLRPLRKPHRPAGSHRETEARPEITEAFVPRAPAGARCVFWDSLQGCAGHRDPWLPSRHPAGMPWTMRRRTSVAPEGRREGNQGWPAHAGRPLENAPISRTAPRQGRGESC